MVGNGYITLLHLSDIHLRKEEIESAEDLDADIRQKLEDDLRDVDVPTGSGLDAIVVTGDIAYAARLEEYQSAHSWLKKLCEVVRCDPSRVWLVPGNHDVDRSAVRKSLTISDAHRAIKNSTSPSDALTERLRDAGSVQLLFQPFTEYNAFARSYQSETRPGRVAWESRELAFDDGTPLVLHGLNSAIVSDEDDDRGRPCQVLGLKQVQLADGDGGVHVTLCHHPPDWLHDQDVVVDHLNSRARLQLYGHKHRQRVTKLDETTVVMAAGALHPDRREGDWDPRYNVLRMRITPRSEGRHLAVEVFERVWSKERTRFDRRGGGPADYPRSYRLPLGELQTLPAAISVPDASSSQLVLDSGPMAASASDPLDERRVVYDLFELALSTRMKLIVDLGLIRDEDGDISDAELVRRVLERARAEGKVEVLRRRLSEELDDK